ncbi:cupin domain-containing protein [Nioella sp. MMSF_3534]|uniref:cupin domain-containing protein n=1 Tax=Nioella sp. MMSF_3534 TaxID=3046720 RepID=UPI00273E8F7D|nr:cupin domain-containing protein [Nioella sp. MMSF_3534]
MTQFASAAAAPLTESEEAFVAHAPADNSPYPPSCEAFSIHADDVLQEGGDPTYGTVTWRTLINGTPDVPREFVLGIAEFGPHGTLLPHRHDPAEFYLGIDGSGVVTIEGVPHVIAAGVAIYVPAGAEHGVVAGPEGLRFTYGFAEGSFESVQYRFSAASA